MLIPQRRSLPQGQLLINHQWCDAADGATMPIIDPTTEAVITDVAKATIADVNAAVEAAHRAFETGVWPRMHHEERAKILIRIADLIDERGEEIGLRESMDMGMPYRDFMDIILPHCSGLFRFFAGQAMTGMNGSYRSS